MKAVVILSEQHSLFPQQRWLLDATYESWVIFPIPAEGLKKEEIFSLADQMEEEMTKGIQVVVGSPIPLLLNLLSWEAGRLTEEGAGGEYSVAVFHNDYRDKKELPGGKIIQVVAKEGWELL